MLFFFLGCGGMRCVIQKEMMTRSQNCSPMQTMCNWSNSKEHKLSLPEPWQPATVSTNRRLAWRACLTPSTNARTFRVGLSTKVYLICQIYTPLGTISQVQEVVMLYKSSTKGNLPPSPASPSPNMRSVLTKALTEATPSSRSLYFNTPHQA